MINVRQLSCLVNYLDFNCEKNEFLDLKTTTELTTITTTTTNMTNDSEKGDILYLFHNPVVVEYFQCYFLFVIFFKDIVDKLLFSNLGRNTRDSGC